MELDDNKLIVSLKLMFFDVNVKTKISKYMKEKINVENMLIFYQLSKIFDLPSIGKTAFNYIERCFTIVADTDSFLQLDFNVVLNILSNSNLDISSEIQIFNAAEKWVNYNIKERIKFAKDLLLKVRFPLLSHHAIKYLTQQPSSFSRANECTAILNKILDNKNYYFQNKSSIYFTNRYCNQDMFNILVCGGYYESKESCFLSSSNVNQFYGCNFKSVRTFPSMIKKSFDHKAVVLKGEVYVLGGFYWEGFINGFPELINKISVEKYSPATNAWSTIGNMYDDSDHFCACGFMDKIFVIGGYYKNRDIMFSDSCLELDTKTYKWKEVARINQARMNAACAVFEGSIVVCGGEDGHGLGLRTVEKYDVLADEWSSMPNMIHGKNYHSLVVVRNKLFVIGCNGDGCELFENSYNQFVCLKSPFNSYNCSNVVSISSKIVIFEENTSKIVYYDVDKCKWSEDLCEVTDQIFGFSCIRVPSAKRENV